MNNYLLSIIMQHLKKEKDLVSLSAFLELIYEADVKFCTVLIGSVFDALIEMNYDDVVNRYYQFFKSFNLHHATYGKMEPLEGISNIYSNQNLTYIDQHNSNIRTSPEKIDQENGAYNHDIHVLSSDGEPGYQVFYPLENYVSHPNTDDIETISQKLISKSLHKPPNNFALNTNIISLFLKSAGKSENSNLVDTIWEDTLHLASINNQFKLNVGVFIAYSKALSNCHMLDCRIESILLDMSKFGVLPNYTFKRAIKSYLSPQSREKLQDLYQKYFSLKKRDALGTKDNYRHLQKEIV
ncbi:hypothetical protein AYI68_g1088 [Smittium mucronatum]|uniref:Uncharacterized protein n=1 Tax=Smittium mucronatum TaxID=133383 RepID=A0A1R0H6A4_9FUNG|nr:hypothetical protein AYI68_g1088 [Smittium mucronatum]